MAAQERPVFIENVTASQYYNNVNPGPTDLVVRVPVRPEEIWLQYSSIPLTPPTRTAWPGTQLGIVTGISGVAMTVVSGTTTLFESAAGHFASMVPGSQSDTTYAYNPTLTDSRGASLPYNPSVWTADGLLGKISFPFGVPAGVVPPFTLAYWRYSGTAVAAIGGASLSTAGAGGETLVADGSGPTLSVRGLTAGNGVTLTGSSSDITIATTTRLASAGGTTLVSSGGGPAFVIKGLSAGSGVSISNNGNDILINNTSPAGTAVTLATTGGGGAATFVSVATGPALAMKSLSATGLSLSTSAGTGITVTNPSTLSMLLHAAGAVSFVSSGTSAGFVVKGISGGTGLSVADDVGGTFVSITNTSPASGVTFTSAGGTETLVATSGGFGPPLLIKGLSAGTGVSLGSTASSVTVASTLTLSSAGGAGGVTLVNAAGPAFATNGLTAGTGITLGAAATAITISLTTSTLTLGATAITLGSTAATITGLTSLGVTTFTGTTGVLSSTLGCAGLTATTGTFSGNITQSGATTFTAGSGLSTLGAKLVYGASCTAPGTNAFAGGNASTASGTNSVALGGACTAAGTNSVALGNGSNTGANNNTFVFSDMSARSALNANEVVFGCAGGFTVFAGGAGAPAYVAGSGRIYLDGATTVFTGSLTVTGAATLNPIAITSGTVNYTPLCVTTAGAVTSLASAGLAGQVLTSNGASVLPSFQNILALVPASYGAASFPVYDMFGGGNCTTNSLALIDTNGRVRVHGRAGTSALKFGPADIEGSAYWPLPGTETASKVFLTSNNIFVLCASGNVWTLGHNTLGQMAFGNTNTYTTPQQCIGLPTNVVTIIGNCDQVIQSTYYALTSTGVMYGWGGNQYGILGNGVTGGSYSTPILYNFGASVTVTQIILAGGDKGSSDYPCTGMVLLSNGTCHMTGYGGQYNLGRNVASTADSNIWRPVQSGNGVTMTGITQIAASGYNEFTTFYALVTPGVLWSWGANLTSEGGNGSTGPITIPTPMLTTGTGPGSTAITKMWGCSGPAVSCLYALDVNGALYSCGANGQGQCGRNAAGTCLSLGVVSLSGAVFNDLYNTGGTGMTVHVTVNDNTRIMTTGYNAQGQSGLNHTTQVNAFTYMPMSWPTGIHSLYATMDGTHGGFLMIIDNNNRLYGCGSSRLHRFVEVDASVPVVRDVTTRLL